MNNLKNQTKNLYRILSHLQMVILLKKMCVRLQKVCRIRDLALVIFSTEVLVIKKGLPYLNSLKELKKLYKWTKCWSQNVEAVFI